MEDHDRSVHQEAYIRDAQGNILAVYTNTGDGYRLSEQPIYGSQRLGTYQPAPSSKPATGNRRYELTEHRGNVLALLTDLKPTASTAHAVQATDYYPFGMPMPGRAQQANYRFGFQGQETEMEIWGGDASFFKFRLSDNRIGRFFAVDPLTKRYPHYTPYSFSVNMVI